MQPNLPGVQVPKVVYVSFTAEIVPQTTEALIACLSDMVNKGVRNVYLMLSTPGGSVMHGITLYNFLLSLPVELTIHNIGNVDSIGNAVFLAGSKRYACPNATFMFHGVGFDLVNQTVRLEEKFLRERLDSLLSDQRRIGNIIAGRTRLPADDVEKLFFELRPKTLHSPLAAGLLMRSATFRFPQATP